MEDKFIFEGSNVSKGENVRIGHFVTIEDDVTIGDNVVIEDYALIQKGAKIGDRTKVGTYSKIGKGAVIGTDCSFTSYCEVRDHCQLGNKVSMGSRCTLSAHTIVGDEVIIKYGFVATDTPDLNKNGEKATCVLKSRSRYGANVTIMPAVTVGENAEIGACSQVRHDVGDNEIWYGSPAKFYKNIMDVQKVD